MQNGAIGLVPTVPDQGILLTFWQALQRYMLFPSTLSGHIAKGRTPAL